MKRTSAVLLAFVTLVLSCAVVSFTDGVGRKTATEKDEYYVYENSIVKAESELSYVMADYAISVFNRVNDEMLSNSNKVYFALIPDKEKLIENNKAQYDHFFAYFQDRMAYCSFLDVYPMVEFSDYYRTDPHLKQESLPLIADEIKAIMGNEKSGVDAYEKNFVDVDFFGAYSKSSDLEVESDSFCYLSNDAIDSLKVSDGLKLYDFDKLYTEKPYDFFLSGNQPLVTITNEKAKNDKRLVVFRDSFASSFAPLLSESYSETVLVDLRYIMSEYVPEYVDFENADVLFLYSTLLLNNSMSMK